MSKVRNYCFTSHVGKIEFKSNMVYLIQGEEVGDETGKEHIQGFVIFKSQRAIGGVIKEFKGVHWEICAGSIDDNIKYCSKEGKFTEWGVRPKGQGTRTDVKRLGDLVKGGLSDREIIEFSEEGSETDWAGTWVRNYRGIREARMVLNDGHKRDWEMDVRIYWGCSGCGKTRKVYDEFAVRDVYVKSVGRWWDGYSGEECVLIDDFDAANAFDIQFDFYLKLLDRYPMKVEIKGGFREFTSRTIIFTSNWDPEMWFITKRNRAALFRRVRTIEHLEGGIVGSEILSFSESDRIMDQKLGGGNTSPLPTGALARPSPNEAVMPTG